VFSSTKKGMDQREELHSAPYVFISAPPYDKIVLGKTYFGLGKHNLD